MDKTGSIDKLYTALFDNAENIEFGRKAFLIPGQEASGRVAYIEGINGALNAFKEVQATKLSIYGKICVSATLQTNLP
jgi:hypothetical protein